MNTITRLLIPPAVYIMTAIIIAGIIYAIIISNNSPILLDSVPKSSDERKIKNH